MKNNKKQYLFIGRHNSEVTVRFIGPVEFLYQYFSKINSDPLPNSDSVIRPFFKNNNDGSSDYYIKKRLVSFVIDRGDDKIKAFSCPISAWNQIQDNNYVKNTDFKIFRRGTGLQTTYDVIKDKEKTTITAEQKQIVRGTLATYSFKNIFVDKEWEFLREIDEPVKNIYELLDL
jgi:hypothetical protein